MTNKGNRGIWAQIFGLLLAAGLLAGCGGATQSTPSPITGVTVGWVSRVLSGSSSGSASSSGAPSAASSTSIASSSSTSCQTALWPCWSTAPVLYHTPAYESPVRADTDDLLLLPGYGLAGNDIVVYRAVIDTTQAQAPPNAIPTSNTVSTGIADLVSAADAPFSLTIHLPANTQTNQSYALWVVDANGRWSNSVLVNDARPLWITPDEVYVSASMGSLPRSLKVVGRNLQPAAGSGTQVRLIGPATYTFSAAISEPSNAALDHYVANVQLPAKMIAGTYAVQLSRDGISWVSLQPDASNTPETLVVLPDPMTPMQFLVGSYTFGSCTPTNNNCAAVRAPCLPDAGDNNDETRCIAAAIAAAGAAGGGTVVFGPGVWNMNDTGTRTAGLSFSNKNVSYDGILIPDGVSLLGAGSGQTKVVRGVNWGAGVPTFSLIGHSTVSGFSFIDEYTYQGSQTGNTFLQLGVPPWRAGTWYNAFNITGTSHVVITQNIFDKPFIAVGNTYAGLPIDHLLVTYNTFGAYATAVQFDGDQTRATNPYLYSDSIVAFNSFYPGSYLDVAATQGTIATQISGGSRTDFSNNLADGTSATYLQNPATDVKGWRAAYFWSMAGNIEMSLVSQNKATCTGDKDGDGEGIAYDNNGNRTGFESVATPVIAATNTAAGSSTVTVQNQLIGAASSWVGDWVQVVQGSGLGQARKIVAVSTGAQNGVATTTLTVAPAFDVLPDSSTQVAVGELYWQVYTIANSVDNTTPPCSPSGLNPDKQSAGAISLFAQMADSATEGNSQFDTGGILLWNTFQLADPSSNITVPTSSLQSSNEVRENVIHGAFSNGSSAISGITLSYSATRDTAPPPVLSFGVAISHNVISNAGGGRLGAISLSPSWYVGPVSTGLGTNAWKMADSTLIFHNTLTDVGLSGSSSVGIGQSAATSHSNPIEWRTVMYGNQCNGRLPSSPLVDNGTSTVRYCPTIPTSSCECAGQSNGLDMSVLSNLPGRGNTVIYNITVSNDGTKPALDGIFSVEASAGVSVTSITSSTGGVTCDSSDATVDICILNTVPVGSTISLVVATKISTDGAPQPTFSVTPQGRSGQFE